MATLWIGNIPPKTSDEELQALLVKYGFPNWDEIEHIAGDGSRPAAMASYHAADPQALQQLQSRVDNLVWKDRRINVSVVSSQGWEK